MSSADRAKWEELYATGARADRPPSRWILDTVARLPNEHPIADIAGGTGRHAIPISRAGRQVVLIDIALPAVMAARNVEPALHVIVANVSSLPLRPRQFGVVVVANFLDREVFTDLIELLVPGGYLVYETYTLPHLDLVRRGVARGPSTEKYLLLPGELPHLAGELDVQEYWEGEVEDEAGRRYCARLLARS